MKVNTLFTLMLICSVSFAGIEYYPADIKENFESKKNSESYIRENFEELFNKYHQRDPKSNSDKLVSNCSGSNCIKLKSLSYDEARSALYGQVYKEEGKDGAFIKDVYCQRKVYLQKTKMGYTLPSDSSVNCEHSWPQSKFNTQLPTGVQKSDLHHLFPTDMKANSVRGNHPFGETEGDQIFSECDSSYIGEAAPLDRSRSSVYFEPPNEIKGDIARALFYFSIRYKLDIDPVQENYLRHWHDNDPVDSDEEMRNEKIERIQGNRNPFIDFPNLVDQVKDF